MTNKGEEAYAHSAKRESIHRIMASLTETEQQKLKGSLKILMSAATGELTRNSEVFSIHPFD